MPLVGATAKVEGYVNSDGVFVVTKIEFSESGSDGDNGSDSNKNDNGHEDNGNNNSDDDNGDDHGGSSGGEH
jgi:hypothetical protein